MKYKLRNNEEVQVHKKIPKGWSVDKYATTQPSGTVWIKNNEPFFKKGKDGKSYVNSKRKSALYIPNEEVFIKWMAEDRRFKKGNHNNFIFDKQTEKKVCAEMNRQIREQRAWEQERDQRTKKVFERTEKARTSSKPKTMAAKRGAAKREKGKNKQQR